MPACSVKEIDTEHAAGADETAAACRKDFMNRGHSFFYAGFHSIAAAGSV